ncbi:hypothetical protein [Pseudomonas putida]|uniref:Uncharacterized protein n=1 Tax=Pseudomonas putida TaxID=303 RepID=A0A8I1EAZ5_PSEPU|nr:hypothetical protein [Pseudomonas putida]MBI6883155.1 hypothetical protein [Pseudomonas putida]
MNKKSSIFKHPKYPFITIGLAYDLDDSLSEASIGVDHVVAPDDWWVYFGDKAVFLTYSSADEAVSGAEKELFDRHNRGEVEHQMAKAISKGDMDLLIRLAEGRGRALGRCEALEEFSRAVDDAYGALRRFRRH